MKLFGMCINWKVVAAVVATAFGFFVFAPKLAIAALPLLVAAICPLSMLLAMGLMGRMKHEHADGSAVGKGSEVSAGSDPVEKPVGRHEHLARLKAQQRELAITIAALEATPVRQALRQQPADYDG
jgi:hypothetical protein